MAKQLEFQFETQTQLSKEIQLQLERDLEKLNDELDYIYEEEMRPTFQVLKNAGALAVENREETDTFIVIAESRINTSEEMLDEIDDLFQDYPRVIQLREILENDKEYLANLKEI